MAGVHFSSRTNSTLFTNCCGVAICDDESKCPHCGREVPGTSRARWNMAMRELYGSKEVEKMRSKYR